MDRKPIGIYIHIPFCNSKCPYCDFYSLKCSDAEMDLYTESLCRAIDIQKKNINRSADTVYFGGGTPSVLGTKRLIKIIDKISKAFTLNDSSEITLEVNPKSGAKLDFSSLKRFGFNRISMGVQSSNEKELKALGRIHRNCDVENIAEKIRKSGIDNISMDLMLGIAHQTNESLIDSINFCDSFNPKHISAYILKIEENTPYYINKEKLNLPDDDKQIELYNLMCEKLDALGYLQYEISNFAKKGYKSKHNLKYWNCDEYLGFGPSAHSFIDGKRFYCPRNINDFYNNTYIDDGNGGDEEEYAIMRLRLTEGLREYDYYSRFNKPIPRRYYENCILYKKSGFLNYDKNGIRFTRKGFLVSNSLITNIMFQDRKF